MPNVDAKVVSRVTNALLNDPLTAEAVIDVSSQGGVVTLSGTVRSHVARRVAEEIASQQEGVMTVVNDLTILTDEKTSPPITLVPPR